MRPLTLELGEGSLRPYFLWDEDLSIDELKARLHGDDENERFRVMAKLLREARDIDVWQFVTPEEVAAALPRIRHRLGRRRAFWEFLIEGWRRDGLLRQPEGVELARTDEAEILVDKLSTILSRGEPRDLADLMLLEKAGHSIEAALPATLAWILSEITIPDNASLPGGVSPADLRAFVSGLIQRLRRLALPRRPVA